MAKTRKRFPVQFRATAKTKLASAIGAAMGSLAGTALAENPELIGQGALALQLQFEGQGRAKEQSDFIHYIVRCAEGAKGMHPGDIESAYMALVDSIKAGLHVGTAEVAHASIFDGILPKNEWEDFLKSKLWTRPGSPEPVTPPTSPKPKKGRKS